MKRIESLQGSCHFGIAREGITPPVGIYHRMWGAAKHDRSAGVHRPLMATVMVFQGVDCDLSESTVQILVAIDHCLLEDNEINLLSAAIADSTGISSESVAIVVSHTHAAGLMSRDRSEFPGGDLIPPYLDKIVETIAGLARRALDTRRVATITYGYGRCNLAGHRDYWDDPNQVWVCGLNPEGAADDAVAVARITDSDDRLIATLVNYACHPTTLAWDNQLISPDFPGAMRETIEAATGAPSVFIQGASGDLGPKEGYVGDVSVADKNGRQLGHAALSALEALNPPDQHYTYQGPVVSGATIGEWAYRDSSEEDRRKSEIWRVVRGGLPLGYRPELPNREAIQAERDRLGSEEAEARAEGNLKRAAELRALSERNTRLLSRLKSLPDAAYPYQISVWRIGHGVWVAVQAEPYNLLQTSLRSRFPETPLIIASLCSSWGPAYLPPAELYGKGIYQETVAVLERGCLEAVIDECATRIEACLAD